MPLQNHDDEAGLDLLEETTLVSFNAVPQALGPFETATLSWHVNAPTGVTIVLDGATVSHAGQLTVEPASTYTYQLAARVRSLIKPLGHVVVTVNLAQCRIWDLFNLDAWLQAMIQSQSNMLPSGARFAEPPVVTISPGQIAIDLKLLKSIGPLPSWLSFLWAAVVPPDVDASADVHIQFGMTLVPDTRVHPVYGHVAGVRQARIANRFAFVNESHSVDVSVPWYLWLVPGAMIGIPIAESGAQEKISAAVPGVVQAIVDALDAFSQPFTGLVKHSLRIDRTFDHNVPILETTWCPPPGPLLAGSA